MRSIAKTIRYGVFALAGAVPLLLSLPAAAAPIFDQKIAQFGLEPRLTCVSWARGKWPWPSKGEWKTCKGHKYEFLQHEYRLTVDGPPAAEAIARVLKEAAMVAAAAAVAAGIGTPTPDPASRIGAAVTAAKAAFLLHLKTRGAAHLASTYAVKIGHRTFW